ncbi:alpha/beta fold hydrolase [Desertivirga xinjiangensis]|uniref:alpha/beta fold hydrolase n=1 Tax=Desertivirga xinjiangensis TaxID=539206 RepID=UPI00210C474A|nr:alpha/beta hydrolase [Pedobacter xinjiangensis]
MSNPIQNKGIEINGIKIFYREAGDKRNPSLLLLHGFPSSSVMFKNLMISLSDKFHLVAPDYPGFGFSDFPQMNEFEYSFSNISACMEQFVETIGLDTFVIYLHDYGSAIGLRLCINNPEKILGLIVQNGNAYAEGLGSQWDETKDFWANPTEEKKKKVMSFLSEDGTKMQYTAGLPDNLLYHLGPELWTLDWALISRPGNIEMQFHLNCDYQSNLQMFEKYQYYFRKYQPPAIIVWGKYDVFFSIEEAYCYQRDLPAAQLHILEGGHMALETNFDEVRSLIKNFLRENTL